MLTILFDGIAYGMLLFVLASGLSVTLGLMNFINLAHGSFAMAGGYVTVILVNRLGMPFVLGVPIAFWSTALLGGLFERTLYCTFIRSRTSTRCCSPSASSSCRLPRSTTRWARRSSFVQIPDALQGQFECLGVGMGRYRLLIIVVCGLLTIALQFILAKTRFGSRLRAAVDDQRVARGLGINVDCRVRR